MFSSKVKTPNTSSAVPEKSEGFRINPTRATIALVLVAGVAGVFATGYMAGKTSNENEKDPVADKKDAGVSKQPSLAKTINNLKNAGSAPPPWGDDNEDTEVCSLDNMDPDAVIDKSIDITDERNEEKANALIAKLGITNETDKEAIISSFLEGCTKVYKVTEKDVFLEDPENEGNECQGTIDFEEEIEVPEEYVDDSIVKTDEELELEELAEDGKHEDVLNSVDMDELLDAADKAGCLESYKPSLQLLEDARAELLLANTPEDRLRIACIMSIRVGHSVKQLENDPCNDNEQLAFINRIIQICVNAISQIGFEGDDDQCTFMFIKAGMEKYGIDGTNLWN